MKTLQSMMNAIRKKEILMSEDEGRGGEEEKKSSSLFQATVVKPEPGGTAIAAKKVPVTRSQQASHLTATAVR